MTLRMKAIIPALLFLTSCASTKFYHNGQLVLDTQANITGLVVSRDGTLTATRIDHSTATRAAGSVIGTAAAGVLPIVTSILAR